MDELLAVALEALGSLYTRDIAAFAVSASVIAIFVWALDHIGAKVLDTTSLLGVGYGGIRSYQSFLLWGLGAGIAAYLGGLAELFDVQSTNAKIMVGIGWPTVLPRLIALSADIGDEPEQDDES